MVYLHKYSSGTGNLAKRTKRSYFTEFTLSKAILYVLSAIYVISVSIVSIFEPYVSLPCDSMHSNLTFANPVYDGSPCRLIRYPQLFFFTREECSYARRLVSAVILGGIIGWERRQADRPAGIRTMSLVSLGSSLFTITSTFAFLTGQNEWDSSRISAAIPSGVGFLGAGLIFKENATSETGASTHVVHGLTTAASLWLSAAVGIACGGELYFAASFGTAIMLLLLRFGPRHFEAQDDEEEEDSEAHIRTDSYAAVDRGPPPQESTEMENLVNSESKRRLTTSFRSRAALASVV